MSKTHIPTYLTLLRIAVIPVMLVLWQIDNPPAAPLANLYLYLFILFTVASVTDFLDGYLARKWNVVSPLGAMLDQIADKLLVVTLLILLVYHHQIPTTPAIVIILRELFISGLRESLALKGATLPVGKSGKWKTALQMGSLALVLLGLYLQSVPVLIAGHVLLMLAAALAFVSACLYLKASWRSLSLAR